MQCMTFSWILVSTSLLKKTWGQLGKFKYELGIKESEVAQSCLTLWDHMVCSLPGSSVHGVFQARVLEWGAIAFFVSLLL